MGTRSATGVRIDGADKLSYNQFDGYPGGVGQEILNELHGHIKEFGSLDQAIEDLRTKARALRMVNESDTPTPEDWAAHKEAHDPNVSTGRDYYSLLREDHGYIIRRLNRGIAVESNSFILDSLFCEYAYILNLDEGTLEVYKGFQKKPHDLGRYGRIEPSQEDKDRSAKAGLSPYYPCALMKTFQLSQLPENMELALAEELEQEANEAEASG